MKKLLTITLILVTTFLLAGCNLLGYDMIDLDYHFNYAIIELGNGEVIEGEVSKWSDSDDGEQLTITMKDGTRYLTSSYNCTLIEK